MATVLRFYGYRVMIYSNDHRPSHVHVISDSSEAVFNLNCSKGPVQLRENYGFGLRELNRIVGELTTSLAALCEAWREIHDDY